ncbi:Bifunctional solanapyrone synthase like protein [Purpureocillium lavendulum]|uniref:Bifunctional solanapyrone synthase like protein n=1 Tax=Purpureocillium lavendulum TaxID=1247861 RepID=A0AB34FB82_9HYPO|nr:Bifunctional solanapyrone synthase like protein [Purpureocillium lavendulum]
MLALADLDGFRGCSGRERDVRVVLNRCDSLLRYFVGIFGLVSDVADGLDGVLCGCFRFVLRVADCFVDMGKVGETLNFDDEVQGSEERMFDFSRLDGRSSGRVLDRRQCFLQTWLPPHSDHLHNTRTCETPNMASSIGNVPMYQNPSRLASNPGVDSMAQNPDALHPLRPNPTAPAPGPDQMRLGNRVVQLDAPSPYSLVSPMQPSPGLQNGDQPSHIFGSQRRHGVPPIDPGLTAALPAGIMAKNTTILIKDPDGKFPCPHCAKSYLHSKHLKRHLLRPRVKNSARAQKATDFTSEGNITHPNTDNIVGMTNPQSCIAGISNSMTDQQLSNSSMTHGQSRMPMPLSDGSSVNGQPGLDWSQMFQAASLTGRDPLFRSVANIRHTAVHRIQVRAKGNEQFLLDAEALARQPKGYSGGTKLANKKAEPNKPAAKKPAAKKAAPMKAVVAIGQSKATKSKKPAASNKGAAAKKPAAVAKPEKPETGMTKAKPGRPQDAEACGSLEGRTQEGDDTQ